MNILIFAQSLSTGGAERVASLWATGFVNQGHIVQLALMADESVPRTYPIPECVSVVSARGNKKGRISGFLSRFKRTGEIIHSFRPDVILVVLHVQDLPIWFYTRGTKTKIIQTEHNSFERPIEAPLSRYEKFVKYYRNRLFDAVTVLTEADKKYIGNRLGNVFVLPNPLAFEPIGEIPDKKKIILAVGRLDVYYYKGFDMLIKAYAAIKKYCYDWNLIIVGSGKEDSVKYLNDVAEESGIDNSIEFVPFTEKLLPLYREAEIFCLPSRYEGFGMVLIEAMSQGCACVACDYKGRQKEIIPSEEFGLVCNAYDQTGLEKQMLRMINDEKLRTMIKNNSPARASCYRLTHIMEYWKDIFNRIGVQ